MINIKKNQQNNNIDTKPPNIINYLKSLSQEAKNLMNEIEDADEDTDIHKLLLVVIMKYLILIFLRCH